MSDSGNVAMTRDEYDELCRGIDGLRKQVEDLKRSASSARELARVAMSHTGTRAMRVEMFCADNGIHIIVCDPAGDEMVTTKRMAGMLDKALWARVGVEFEDKDPVPRGSID